MTDQPDPSLDRFETALLAQLKNEVAGRSPADEPRPTVLAQRRSGRPSRRWYVPSAAAAVALAVTAVAYSLWPTPAFAVTGRNDGEVHVRVNRLEGADELERALGKRGIAADISYLAEGKQCAPGRYSPVRTPGLMLGVGAKSIDVTIPPNAVGADETFVLSAAVVPLPNGVHAVVDFDIARGPVGPCQVIDAP